MGSKSAPSPPAPPDPVATANAQAAMNEQTARTSARLSRVSQVTPYGKVEYQQNHPENPDLYEQVITLSPEEQHLLNLTQAGQKTYGETALSQLDKVKGTLAEPIETDYGTYRDQAVQAQMARLNPEFQMQDRNLRAQLTNAGITEGSEAWDNAYRPFLQQRNDALLQAQAQGGNAAGQALQQQIALRNQPINEAAALLSGQQVQVPQMQQTAPVNVAPTDYLGAVNSNYQGQMANYNAQMQARNANLGGMYGLLGTGITAGMLKFSDERLKEDVRRVGSTDEGTPVYTYRYKGDPDGTTHMGVMAQELMRTHPEAVHMTPTGFLAVDYARAA